MLLFRADCYAAGSRAARVRIDVHHSDEAIRQELLGYTPIGSDATAVLEFVHTRLYSKGFGSSIGIMPKAGIGVTLGDYSGGVFLRTAVEAGWHFDENRKLRVIEIRRYTGKGGSYPVNDPAFTPKVKIDLHHSDESIRDELLRYTPLGSQMAEIGRFIALRLYSQSGELDGVALTGKAGTAVILGEYGGGGTTPSRKSIRVVWSFNEGQRLENIYIKRINL